MSITLAKISKQRKDQIIRSKKEEKKKKHIKTRVIM